MRTTLDIDDDVLAAAKDLARAEGRTMGEVISDLVRRALTQPGLSGLAEPHTPFAYDDFPTFPARAAGAPVTSDMVRNLQDEIDREDALPWDHESDQPRGGADTTGGSAGAGDAKAQSSKRKRKA